MAMKENRMAGKALGSQGFTLVELMITVALATMTMAAVYTAYLSMQQSYLAQEQVSEMQQTLRAAMDTMVREIRMAGYNPAGSTSAKIESATKSQLRFTRDITDNAGTGEDGDGDVLDANEDVTFGFSLADDANNDGVADAGVAPFARQAFAAGFQDMVESIVAVEFNYILDNGTTSTNPAGTNTIRAVQISMLARADRPDPRFAGGQTFRTGSGTTWGPYADQFRRRLMVTTVQCRNLAF